MTDAHGGERTEGGPDGTSGLRPPRPPGGSPRPRQDRREQTRTALLTAAARLWADRGIHGASLDDIAAAAGLTKGAVYSNFAGKTDLLLALMERITSDLPRTDVCEELHAAAQDADPAGRSSSRHDAGDGPRRLTLLLVEFWLYGMRDYAAGWRIADWYAERRAQLAGELEPADGPAPDDPAPGGLAPGDRATLTMALDFGLAFQHLLDPARVPADLYRTGKTLMQRREP
ncbi:TetR/AcrR family transcriptional regulator [Spirillospora sp. CA-128828]|uniref:TetR/AcrR family transcriptional regulator n=1 Tax=Spirillospora sp. CA-128828 TaxID=3240033 RepID=UPI003D8E8D76